MKSNTAFEALDNASMNPFIRRVTVLSGLGVFLEGYNFTNIASALVFLVPYFRSLHVRRRSFRFPPFLGRL